MNKAIQKVTAWRYPCEGKPFHWSVVVKDRLFFDSHPMRTRKDLKLRSNGKGCLCGRNCKPQKIIIEVRGV